MSIPKISHLQAAVLDSLTDCVSGRELRVRLAGRGIKQSSPSFYRMMARLEDLGLVEGSYVNREIAGQIVRERRYTIRAGGIAALEEAKLFYNNMNLGGRFLVNGI